MVDNLNICGETFVLTVWFLEPNFRLVNDTWQFHRRLETLFVCGQVYDNHDGLSCVFLFSHQNNYVVFIVSKVFVVQVKLVPRFGTLFPELLQIAMDVFYL